MIAHKQLLVRIYNDVTIKVSFTKFVDIYKANMWYRIFCVYEYIEGSNEEDSVWREGAVNPGVVQTIS
jgi:hypothetical protein